MSNTRQYRYFHRGDNEFLANPDNKDDEGYIAEWEALNEENVKAHPDGIKIEFTEDMYANDEYFELPEWVEVTINDEHLLELKMARGILKAMPTASAINFGYSCVDIHTSKDFGGIGRTELCVTEGGAYIIINEKHSSSSMELYIAEQFNQAIGETT